MYAFYIVLFVSVYYLLPFLKPKPAEDIANELQSNFLEIHETIKADVEGCCGEEMLALRGAEHRDEIGNVADWTIGQIQKRITNTSASCSDSHNRELSPASFRIRRKKLSDRFARSSSHVGRFKNA